MLVDLMQQDVFAYTGRILQRTGLFVKADESLNSKALKFTWKQSTCFYLSN